MPPLNLLVGHSSITVRVQPVVLFTICDAYIRRSEGKERVIGTLLGTIAEGVVDIRNCYAVPHNESMDQVRQQEQPARKDRHEQLPDICLSSCAVLGCLRGALHIKQTCQYAVRCAMQRLLPAHCLPA